MWLLVRELTGSSAAGVLAGTVFAFNEFFLIFELAHLQVLSAHWMPLALYGFRRYFARGSRAGLAPRGAERDPAESLGGVLPADVPAVCRSLCLLGADGSRPLAGSRHVARPGHRRRRHRRLHRAVPVAVRRGAAADGIQAHARRHGGHVGHGGRLHRRRAPVVRGLCLRPAGRDRGPRRPGATRGAAAAAGRVPRRWR